MKILNNKFQPTTMPNNNSNNNNFQQFSNNKIQQQQDSRIPTIALLYPKAKTIPGVFKAGLTALEAFELLGKVWSR